MTKSKTLTIITLYLLSVSISVLAFSLMLYEVRNTINLLIFVFMVVGLFNIVFIVKGKFPGTRTSNMLFLLTWIVAIVLFFFTNQGKMLLNNNWTSIKQRNFIIAVTILYFSGSLLGLTLEIGKVINGWESPGIQKNISNR